MTTPADQDVNAHLSGVDPGTGNTLDYQQVRVRARTVWGNLDGQQPFQTEFNGAKQPVTSATYDAVTGASEQISWRHIDPYGNVADPKKLQLLMWYWFLDGCPTPLSQKRLGDYITLASELRPWPTGFAGAMPGEPTRQYSAFPPSTPTPLDNFLPATPTDTSAPKS